MDIVTTVLEGKKQLESLERQAASAFRRSDEEFSVAMLALWKIHQERLWLYAEDADGTMLQDYEDPQFKMYLGLFCAKNRISRSGTYDHLKTIRVWEALGLGLNQLEAIGVRRARPMRSLIEVDGRTGEIELPPDDVIENLPPGETPIDRVRQKIVETLIEPEIPLTQEDVRRSFTVDTGAASEYVFYEDGRQDICCDFSSVDETWTGVVIPGSALDNVPAHIAKRLKRKLGVQIHDL